MPEYAWKAEDGEQITRVLRMRDVRPERILRDEQGLEAELFPDGTLKSPEGFNGEHVKIFQRDYSSKPWSSKMENDAKYPYVSVRLAGRIDESDAPHTDTVVRGVPRENVPVVLSKKHERELMAKYNLRRE